MGVRLILVAEKWCFIKLRQCPPVNVQTASFITEMVKKYSEIAYEDCFVFLHHESFIELSNLCK